jgi:ferritin-like metal-binding protein YciE
LRALADQLGETEVSKLFASTLKEEESADSLLTDVSQPIIKHASKAESETHLKAAR